ncbi:AGE family epimerase/isomerase [Adhaeribacter radiodurans]|uniref:AGE family epimerase/isomerase n=1 Tax=Adhaeribacter radiodurans TaxID=2745197 RepID=A0A7L7LBV6_9BACT|nr:AGE family epimerase/isomerase [Adhaeribacter radiodurans]QMU30015.1 AGE family epimerase/isomerase [Adhaeribacter radiodurans]
MKYFSLTALVLCAITTFYLTAFKPNDTTDRAQLAAAIDKSIRTEMLNKWYPRAIDKQYGGFLSTFTYDWKQAPEQDKFIVTQARHIWSNARASQFYPTVEYYKAGGKHGFTFLRDVMWDKTYGGFYALVDRQGKVKENPTEPKNAYGNAFGIYALATYYMASGDTAALNLAKKTFLWLEKHSHDPKFKGYYQALERDGTPIQRHSKLPSTSEVGYKDQNSSIHILEALTELYQVWPDPLVRERLQEMLVLIRDTITTPKGYLILFLKPDWQPISYRDSSAVAQEKHRGLDHVSFGHDVETAYLMLEASHVLGLKEDPKTMTVAKRMIDHALANGWDAKAGGFYDEGYYFKDKPGITIVKGGKNWWAQAEGLNTLLLMADHFPNDKMQYYQKFLQQWKYINAYLIDHEHGDWYPGGIDKEPEQKTALKGQIWKGNYHQFRALSNCVLRLQPDKTAPAAPKNIRINAGTLTWEKVRDNKNMLGYNIYQNGQKIGFTPLASFVVPTAKKGSKITVQAIDLAGNLSANSAAITF